MDADRLKQWRAARDMTQAELAAALNVAPITVSQWEVGRRRVPAWLDMALAGVDGVTCRTAASRPPRRGQERANRHD